MRGGIILIIVGLLLAYIGVTGRYKCFTVAFDCLLGDGEPCGCNDAATTGASAGINAFPSIAPLQPIRPIVSMFG